MSTTPPPSFCIVVPMYNEEENALRCVTAIQATLSTIPTRTGMIVVNDGSADRTAEALKSALQIYPQLVIETHGRNSGYGAANRTGFARARIEGYDYALAMDSDLTNDPKYIRDFFEAMRGGADIIKATRYAQGGKAQGVPLKRSLVSWIGNGLARMVLRCGVTDFTNGFRAIRTDFLPKLDTRERGFAMLMEEMHQAARHGAKFAEVPYVLTAREGSTESKFKYSPAVYWAYLKFLLPGR